MTVFNYATNFNANSIGPFTTAAKTTAWGHAPAADGDPNGIRYSIVAEGRYGGQCCQCFFPAGQNGNFNQEYQMFRDSSGVVVNLEFDWKAKPGFDFTHDVGKIGPSIMWGPRSGTSAGVFVFIIWSQAKTGQPAVFELAVQNNATGGNYNQPIVRSDPINIGQWYHFKLQMLGGPGGYVNGWLDGTQLWSYQNITTWPTHINDTVMFDDYYHYGGGGPGPSTNIYALQDNLQYYSETGAPTLSAGAFTLTGNSVSFKRSYTSVLGSGLFAMNGGVLSFAGAYGIAAQAAAFLMNGIAAVLTSATSVSLAAGSFAFTGVPAGFSGAALFGGPFTLAGGNTILRYSPGGPTPGLGANVIVLVGAGFDLTGYNSLVLDVLRPDGTQFTLSPPRIKVGTKLRSYPQTTFTPGQYIEYYIYPGEVTIPGDYTCLLKYVGPVQGQYITNSTFVIPA